MQQRRYRTLIVAGVSPKNKRRQEVASGTSMPKGTPRSSRCTTAVNGDVWFATHAEVAAYAKENGPVQAARDSARRSARDRRR